MNNQNWLIDGSVKLACTSSLGKNKRICAVLLPGLSHAMCDMDYFMSKLARHLAQHDIYTLQVDPSGHGDSHGSWSDIDLNVLRKDIEIVVNHLSNKQETEQVFLIGRGLIATLLSEFHLIPKVTGIAGVTPYCLSPEFIQSNLQTPSNDIDAAEFIIGKDYVNYSDFKNADRILLNALGMLVYNVHGSLFPRRLIHDLMDYKSIESFKNCKKDTLWLFPQNDGKILPVNFSDGVSYPVISLYDNFSMPRDPLIQYQIIEIITQWIINKINTHADTDSN